jgi:hypothetical protein
MMNEIRVTGCVVDPGNVALPSTATLTVEIGGTTACTGYGQYTASKSFTLNQPTLNVVLTNGFRPSLGLQFKLLSWGTLSGSFGNVVLPQLPTGLTWNTSALYTTGTITVNPSAVPTINVTSGGDQSLTSPGAAVPIAFTLSGTGTLTAIARSSNTGLLPNSGISVDPGCGSTRETCTASLAIASGQTGSATVSLTVDDMYGQAATATATIEVSSGTNAGSGSGAGGSSGGNPGSGSGAGGSSSGNTGSGGGGGNLDLVSLLGLAALATYKRRRRGGHAIIGDVVCGSSYAAHPNSTLQPNSTLENHRSFHRATLASPESFLGETGSSVPKL